MTKIQTKNVDRRPVAAAVPVIIAEVPGEDLAGTIRSIDAQTLSPGDVFAVKRFASTTLPARAQFVLCVHAGDLADPTLLEKSLFVLEQGGADVSLTQVVGGTREHQGALAIAMVRAPRFNKVRGLLTPNGSPHLRATVVARGLDPALLAEPLLTRRGATVPVSEARAHGDQVILITAGRVSAKISTFLEPVCTALKEQGFVVLVLTEDGPQPQFPDSIRSQVAGVFHLSAFLNESSRLDFLINVARRHSARIIWNIGPSFARAAFLSLRQCFPTIGLVDLVCEPAAKNYIERSYLVDHILAEREEVRDELLLQGESQDRISLMRAGNVDAVRDWCRTTFEHTRYTCDFSIVGSLPILRQALPRRRPLITPALRTLMMFLSPPRLRANLKNAMLLRRIRRSEGGEELLAEHFDPVDYLRRYPDVAASGVSPLHHYAFCGFTEHRDPSEGFRTDEYLRAHMDVARAGLNPLLHYLTFHRAGTPEGRRRRPE